MYALQLLLLLYLKFTFLSAQYDDIRKYYPLERIPIFSMPYIANMAIPRPAVPIKPTPTKTTKILAVVTKYVLQNPVCIKVSGKKPMCKSKRSSSRFTGLEYTVNSSGYAVQGRRENSRNMENTLEASIEEDRAYLSTKPTPSLSAQQLNEILIEDRLDHLEEILPHYTRRRVYQTKTITVTKTTQDAYRATATLLVKNCVPVGMERCPKKSKKKTKEFVGTSVVLA